jgi:hypothetical protein
MVENLGNEFIEIVTYLQNNYLNETFILSVID